LTSSAIIWSSIAQIVRAGFGLYTIPLCLSYLGKERYGLWMTILSIFAFAGFFDFGYTLYLRNKLNEAHVRGKKLWFRKIFFHGCIQGIICALFIALFTACLFMVDLGDFFAIKNTFLRQELSLSIIYLGILTIVTISTGVFDNYICITTDMINYRKLETVINILSIVALILAIKNKASMPTLAAIVYSPLAVLKVLSLGWIIYKEGLCILSNKLPTINEIKYSYKKSFKFALSIGSYALLFAMPNIMIGKIFTLRQVGDFSPVYKIVQIPITLLQVSLPVIWIKYSKFISLKNIKAIKKIYLQSMLGGFLCLGAFSLGFLLLGDKFISWWTSGDIKIDFSLQIFLSLWLITSGLSLILSTFLACSYDSIFIFYCQMVNVILLFVLGKVFSHNYGISGFALGMFFSYLIAQFLPFVLRQGYILRKTHKSFSAQSSASR
jgi:O-antigen/teichoic acid export membrane protein